MSGATRDVRFGSKAGMCSAQAHVRYGPKADMATSCAEFFADPNTAAEFAADY
jgi:hypothetical protein